MRDASNVLIWENKRERDDTANAPWKLKMGNDGNVQITNGKGTITWETGTAPNMLSSSAIGTLDTFNLTLKSNCIRVSSPVRGVGGKGCLGGDGAAPQNTHASIFALAPPTCKLTLHCALTRRRVSTGNPVAWKRRGVHQVAELDIQ